MPTFLSGTKEDLHRAMDEVNRKMQEEEARAKAQTFGLPYIDLHNFPVDLNVLGMLTEEEAKAAQAVPFYKELNDLRLGVIDPENNLLKEKAREFSQKNKVSLYVISKKSLEQSLKFYSKVVRPKAPRDEVVRVDKQENYQELLKILQNEGEQEKKNRHGIFAGYVRRRHVF